VLGIAPLTLLHVADFNGDSKDDLAIANPCLSNYDCSNGAVRVLLGNGDGTLKISQYQLRLPFLPLSISAGDLNNDGKIDLVVASYTSNPAEPFPQGSLFLLTGNGKGSFEIGESYLSGGTRARNVEVADFNRDGKADVMVSSEGNSALLLGNGDGTLQAPQIYNVGGLDMTIDDFNRDGRPDVAFGGTSVLMNIAHR
jgi:hypothetical protein